VQQLLEEPEVQTLQPGNEFMYLGRDQQEGGEKSTDKRITNGGVKKRKKGVV